MLVRNYHNCIVVSAREETPQPDGDGWDHILVRVDKTPDGGLLVLSTHKFPTLAEAISAARAMNEALSAATESDAKSEDEGEPREEGDPVESLAKTFNVRVVMFDRADEPDEKSDSE